MRRSAAAALRWRRQRRRGRQTNRMGPPRRYGTLGRYCGRPPVSAPQKRFCSMPILRLPCPSPLCGNCGDAFANVHTCRRRFAEASSRTRNRAEAVGAPSRRRMSYPSYEATTCRPQLANMSTVVDARPIPSFWCQLSRPSRPQRSVPARPVGKAARRLV